MRFRDHVRRMSSSPGAGLVLRVHLVELVDAADAVVAEHQGPRLDDRVVDLLVALHRRGQT